MLHMWNNYEYIGNDEKGQWNIHVPLREHVEWIEELEQQETKQPQRVNLNLGIVNNNIIWFSIL